MHGMVQLAHLRLKPSLALLAVTLLLSACATQTPQQASARLPGGTTATTTTPAGTPEQEALRSLATLQDRLYRVSAPLLVNNTDLCKRYARNLLGFTAKNKYSYSNEFSDAAQNLFGLDDQLQIINVLTASGAAQAGVQRGDRLVAVDDKPLPQGAYAERQAAGMLAPLVGGRSNVKLTVLRNGANLGLNIPLTRACGFGIELGNADNVNSYADGRRVLVTRGMMSFVQSDDELAYVLAKEIAHNALGHADKQKMSGTVGSIIDNLIRVHPDLSTMAGSAGIKPMPAELDAAADTLSLYMLARAGYRIDNVPKFWGRLANQTPATVLNGHTALHPATAQRLAVMEKIIVQIKDKQAGKKPLLP